MACLTSRRTTMLAVAMAIAAHLAGGCTDAHGTGGGQPIVDKHASMTIYPVSVADAPLPQVAEVVGMMLERGGMDHLELASTLFTPPKADLVATADAFAAFIAAAPPPTEYALYGECIGTPSSGVKSVRTIVVSKAGQVVWADDQTSSDADFDRIKPRNPMDCCRLMATRLRPVFGLADPFRKDAPQGPLARAWAARTGVPDDAELAAIAARTKAFCGAAPKATLAVLRPHAPVGIDTSAADLARRIADGHIVAKTIAVDETPAVEIVGDMNEQKVLWSMARGFAAFVKKHPPETDYVLLADYLVGRTPDGALRVGGVHLALCDRAGELVLVDFQNSRQRDFQAIDPKSIGDCDELAAKRLVAACR